ncbi:MAG: hypothetical protein PWP46_1400 [Fusobacteriaceae bacterium]|nr:hypothetical protein [Fusobacteriaceae bacterium]
MRNILKHENEVLINLLNIEGMKIIQRNDYLNFSLDSVVVSHFLTINRGVKKVLDLGTGNGIIPLLLSRRCTAKIYGLELQEISVELAKRNVLLNNLEDRIEIIHGDIKKWNNFFDYQSFDAVISNPPFFKFDGNKNQLNDLDQLTLARHEISITLEEIVKTASDLLRERGYFAMVHRADRLEEILEIFSKYKLTPKRLRFCHSRLDRESKLIVIEGMKNAEKGLKILPPLITHEGRDYSKEVKELFK